MVVLGVTVLACAAHERPDDLVRGDAACARADTFFQETFPRPAHMRGRATFDVDKYQFRGHFDLQLASNGDAVLEFSGSTLLGGHREDAVLSLSGDTLRVLDRERGHYYEGDEVTAMVDDGTRVHGDWALALRRVLASGCAGIDGVQPGETGMSGLCGDGPFSLKSRDGVLEAATWPNPAPQETFRDRLEVRYRWKDRRLNGIEASLPTRGWRVRLESD